MILDEAIVLCSDKNIHDSFWNIGDFNWRFSLTPPDVDISSNISSVDGVGVEFPSPNGKTRWVYNRLFMKL